MKSININDIKEMNDIELIDVREPFEFAKDSIKGAKNIPMMGLIMNHQDFLSKDKTYYIMCQAGSRSMQVCTQLDNLGYDVINLEGGIMRYQK